MGEWVSSPSGLFIEGWGGGEETSVPVIKEIERVPEPVLERW